MDLMASRFVWSHGFLVMCEARIDLVRPTLDVFASGSWMSIFHVEFCMSSLQKLELDKVQDEENSSQLL